MSIEINITDNIVQVTPTEQQVDINITENPIEVNVTDEIVLIAQTGLQGPAGPGVAIGGTAGQILAKNSSTNYDTLWINNAVGTVTSVATSAPLTGGTITSSGTIGITQSSASGDGYLSSTDWTTFNNKQNALTNPITGTGTINYVPKFTSLNGIGNSLIYDNGSNVSIASTSSLSKLNISNKLLLFDTTPTNAYSATKMGYTFASNGAAWSTPAGSIIEDTANGTILSYAVNMAQVGTVKSAYSGGIFRFDTRPGEDRFIVLGRPVGSFIEFVSFYVDLNTGSTYLNPVYGSTLIGTSVNAGYKLDVNGTTRLNGVTTIGTVNAATTDTDRFLVSDSGVIKYRTGTQILSDIGGQGALTLTTTGTSGAATLIGNTLNVPQYEAEGNYVTTATTLTINGTTYDLSANRSWSVGTVTSVGLSMPVAFSVANTPITSSGTLAVTAVGTSSQYIRGDGQLATLPSGSSGGSSVNYYLNGSVAASVAGYQQMSNSAIIGAGTDFTLVGNGLIAQFLTDVANPNRLLIPGGAWNFEMYFNVSSSGGNAKFYVELLKYDGTTFTSIASSSAVAEEITGGTTIDLYITSLAVPETVLLTSDRLAIRVYIVDNSGGRTARLHTENSHLCEIITTFAGGIAALNGLTANTQYLAVGTAGTDFAISSLTDTHTFNLPTASATNRGALSSTDWTTFNNKPSVNIYTGDGTLTGNRIVTMGSNTLSFEKDLLIYGLTIGRGSGGLSTNITFGVTALRDNTTGDYNVAIGDLALLKNTTGRNNIAIGSNSQRESATGQSNTSLGSFALYSKEVGDNNVALGVDALSAILTGSENIGIGYQAGKQPTGSLQYAENSIFIGSYTKANSESQTNQIVIGYNATGLGSNTTVLGNSSTTFGRWYGNLLVGGNTNNGVDALQVTGSALFSSSVTASSLIKSGGTSTQFLKADGSVDSTTYGTFTLPSLTAGSVLFSNGTTIAQDNANFFWDDTNNRLGIGTTSPSTKLVVDGTVLTTSTLGSTSGSYAIDHPGINTWRIGVTATNSSTFHIGNDSGGSFVNKIINITSGGNVLIGTTTDAGYKLNINGVTRFQSNVRFANGVWNVSDDSISRLFFTASGRTFFGSADGYEYRSSTDTTLMQLNNAGNLGLGVTPSAGWASDANNKVIQLAGGSVWTYSTSQMSIAQNMLYNGANNVYVNNGEASYYRQRTSQHEWHIAPSGTAGNTITFTQAMTLNASGRLLLGTTTDNGLDRLQVSGSTKITGKLDIDSGSLSTSTNVYNNGDFISNWIGNSTVQLFSIRNNSTSGVYLNTQNSNTLYLGVSAATTGGTTVNHLAIASTGAATFSSSVTAASYTVNDAGNISVGTTTGTKIGTATSQKLSFWNATPIIQPTTSIAESAFVENLGGSIVNVDSTFDGYTIQQIAKALRNAGLLA